ncbi:transcriptional regulator, partial [Oleoguttula sp. CCFEE 5521]
PGKSAQKVRKADEASLDGLTAEAAPPKKPRRGGNKSTDILSSSERETLQKVLNDVYEAIDDLVEESSEPDVQPRGIIDPFMDLPPRSMYADYYQLIRQPIAMKQIENKIKKAQYQNLRQFRGDVGLLCRNCRQYNEDGSVLYNDANLIEETCLQKLREETANLPEWQDFDEADSVADTSRINSSVGTPQPVVKSGIKLKLNGRGAGNGNANLGSASRGGTDSRGGSDDED